MFKGNPAKTLQNFSLAKQAVKEGGEYFEKKERDYEFQNSVFFKARGENVTGLKISDDMKSMVTDDPEMFEDILATAFNTLKATLTEERTKAITERAKQLKLPNEIINAIMAI